MWPKLSNMRIILRWPLSGTACSWGVVGGMLALACSSRPPAQAEAAPAPGNEPHDQARSAEVRSKEAQSQSREGYGNLWGTDITEPALSPSARVGHLPRDEIQKVVRAAYPDYRRCYEAGLGRDTTLTGTVAVRFVIEPDGSVKFAASEEDKTTLSDEDVVSCALALTKGLLFPPPEGGPVVVVYPFRFEPQND